MSLSIVTCSLWKINKKKKKIYIFFKKHTTLIIITDKKKLRRNIVISKKKHQIQIKFEMQCREFWERQFTVFPCKLYTYR